MISMDFRHDLGGGDGIYPGKAGGVNISYDDRSEVMIMATIPFEQLLEAAQRLGPEQKRISQITAIGKLSRLSINFQ
jgi:hypothetical protein